jgi:mannitol/fructose-specific phosphotransferase system IIA component (Ntr-type)
MVSSLQGEWEDDVMVVVITAAPAASKSNTIGVMVTFVTTLQCMTSLKTAETRDELSAIIMK